MMTQAFKDEPQATAKLLGDVDKSLQARSMKEAGHDKKTIGKTLHEADPFGLKSYFMQEEVLSAKADTPGHDKNGYPDEPEYEEVEPDPRELNPEQEMNRGPRPR